MIPLIANTDVSIQAAQVFTGTGVLLNWKRLVKRFFDIAVASCLLIILLPLLPLFALIALAIRMDGGRAFFVHRRVGEGGQLFRCLKFRTMIHDAENYLATILEKDKALAQEWKEYKKLKNDPRITKIGSLLRKSSLDELPQLINILRGDMSLVGPRPILTYQVAEYDADIALYYKVKPGLTGLWQISGRSKLSAEDRVRLDIEYVRTWSLRKDFVILAKTLPAVMLGDGAC